MSLVRHQLLAEMGLSPRWVLREQPAVTRTVQRVASPQAASASPTVSQPPAEQPTPAGDGQRGALSADIAQQNWDELRQSIAACRACALCAERKQAD